MARPADPTLKGRLIEAATAEFAAGGYAAAQYNLGRMYELGLGVEPDIDQVGAAERDRMCPET